MNKFFECSYNKLISLKGIPKIIKASVYLMNNKIHSLELENFPEYIGQEIYVDNNPELGKYQNIKDFNEIRVELEKDILQHTLEHNTKKNNIVKI